MTTKEVLDDLYKYYPAMRPLIDACRRGEITESEALLAIDTREELWLGRAA